APNAGPTCQVPWPADLSVAVGKTRDVLEALDAGRLVDEPGGLARGDQCLRAIEQAGRLSPTGLGTVRETTSMRATHKGTGRRKSRKIWERSWKFRAAADEGNARTLIAVTTAQGSWVHRPVDSPSWH